MKRFVLCGLIIGNLMVFAGCGYVGKDFDESTYQQIVVGKTTQQEIESMFGKPFKTGIQNGYPLWVYEYNEYHSLGGDVTKDLIVVFDHAGVVRTHQYNTNIPSK